MNHQWRGLLQERRKERRSEAPKTADVPLTVPEAIEACAQKVEQAGCVCKDLHPRSRAVFRSSGHYGNAVVEHDPRCPVAVAEALRRMT